MHDSRLHVLINGALGRLAYHSGWITLPISHLIQKLSFVVTQERVRKYQLGGKGAVSLPF